MVFAWLGPEVASWSFAARLLAYDAALTGYVLSFHIILPLYHRLLRKLGILSQAQDAPPTMGTFQLVGTNVYGWFATTMPAAIALAAYNPTPSSWTIISSWGDLWTYLVPLILYQIVVNFIWDTQFYFWHLACHTYPQMYRHFHKTHHDTTAMMSVHTSGYDDPFDFILGGGLITGLATWMACYVQSYWLYALVLHYIVMHTLLGHTGADFHISEWAGWAHLLFSPAHISQGIIGNPATPMFHSSHHHNPLANFSLYSTYWDDKFGTAKPALAHHSIYLMLLDMAYGAAMLTVIQTTLTHPVRFFGCGLLLALVPYRVQAALLSPLTATLPRLRVWDWVRAAYRVTYAPQGSLGAFVAEPKQRYIFCYHPQNIIARGAWYTFAGMGLQSPVASLGRCRLAVGRVLMAIPGVGQALRALGCCSSSWEELRALLRDLKVATSVAITPDGFGQAKYMGSYSLVLNKRRGFVRLAHETGAVLVPVLGVGEPQIIPGTGSWAAIIPKFITCSRTSPVRVVFGRPVVVLPDESVDQTHSRYVAELRALGKLHGVLLDMVE